MRYLRVPIWACVLVVPMQWVMQLVMIPCDGLASLAAARPGSMANVGQHYAVLIRQHAHVSSRLLLLKNIIYS
jgi:hypothetical protein